MVANLYVLRLPGHDGRIGEVHCALIIHKNQWQLVLENHPFQVPLRLRNSNCVVETDVLSLARRECAYALKFATPCEWRSSIIEYRSGGAAQCDCVTCEVTVRKANGVWQRLSSLKSEFSVDLPELLFAFRGILNSYLPCPF